MNEHRAYCTLRQLNDIERIFGQKFDDEKFIELIRSSHYMREYQMQISRLMAQTKPTPLSVKDLYSFYTLGFLTRIDPQDTIDFWKMVADEIQWRADNHIAAVGNERFRWIRLAVHPFGRRKHRSARKAGLPG